MTERLAAPTETAALDHLCWTLCWQIADNYPPEARAAQCITALEAGLDGPLPAQKAAYESGYHDALYFMAEDLAAVVARQGIDVTSRANRVQRRNGKDPFDLPSDARVTDPEFLDACGVETL